jgi:hypothetical protein
MTEGEMDSAAELANMIQTLVIRAALTGQLAEEPLS